ncbi:MAG: hypothetical protein ACI4SR_03220 [Faecalibacillus sp.]
MEKEFMEQIRFYLSIIQLEKGHDEFGFLMLQNQIFLHHYFKTITDDEFMFLKDFNDDSIKKNKYMEQHHYSENQYYAKFRKILRKMKKEDGTYHI